MALSPSINDVVEMNEPVISLQLLALGGFASSFSDLLASKCRPSSSAISSRWAYLMFAIVPTSLFEKICSVSLFSCGLPPSFLLELAYLGHNILIDMNHIPVKTFVSFILELACSMTFLKQNQAVPSLTPGSAL